MVAMPTGTKQPRAFVNYVQPSFKELKRRFPLHVDADYEGAHFRIKSDVVRKPLERKFWAVYIEPLSYGSYMDTLVTWQQMQVELERRGLRFAVYEELLAFAKKYPSEEGKFPVVAFGSSNSKGQVPILECCGAGYELRLRYYAKHWTGYQFLAVACDS